MVGCCLLQACSYLKGNGWGVDVGEVGGVEEEYIGVGMNIMYEKRIYFQLKKLN